MDRPLFGSRGVIGTIVVLVSWGATPQASTLDGRVIDRRGPVEGAVVYLVPIGEGPRTVPSAEPDTPAPTVLVDQARLRFEPSLVSVTAGSTVEFLNSDPIMHNVFSPVGGGAGFNLGTYPASESRTYTFREPGTFVMLCHVHPEMAAWVIVAPGPHHASTNGSGAFSLSRVEPGEYEVRVWHSRRDMVVDTLAVPGVPNPEWTIEIPRIGRR